MSPPGSPQPTPKPGADPQSPLAHPGGTATLTKAPLVPSALNSRGEGRPVQDPRAFPAPPRMTICPAQGSVQGFWGNAGERPSHP